MESTPLDLSDVIHTVDLSDGIHTLDQTAVTLCCGLLGQARACLMNRFTFSCQCFIVPFGKFGSPYLGKATAAALPIPTSVCSCFRVSRQWCGGQCLEFLTCSQMLMPVIAHGVCTDTAS